MSRRRQPEADRSAAVVERLSALVSAGVAPPQAWRYLGEVGAHPFVVAVVRRIDGGASVAEAIAAEAGRSTSRGVAGARHRGSETWGVLAAAWTVAAEAGAPLARCLDEIADTLRTLGQADRDTAAALASPVATTRLVLVLPVVSVAGGALLGLDTLRVLVTTPGGGFCLVGGLLLSALGSAWSRRLVRRSARSPSSPGLLLDLTAVAVLGGGSLPAARRLVLDTVGRLVPSVPNGGERAPAGTGTDAQREGEAAEIAVLDEVLALAALSGAPPAQLLRSEAVRLRRDAVADAQRRTAELGVWLMLPLGICVLPAFILLAVLPVLLSVLPVGLPL